MVEEDKTPDLRLPDGLVDNPDIVPLKIAAYLESTTPEQLQTYVAAVRFVAWWVEKQDGAAGNDTAALFDQFKDNVCAMMARGTIKA